MKNKIIKTVLGAIITNFLLSCAHTRPKFQQESFTDKSALSVQVLFKSVPQENHFKFVKDFHIVEESIVQKFSQDKALATLNSLAKENNADLVVIDDFRSEYAKDSLIHFTVQSEVIGKFYSKK